MHLKTDQEAAPQSVGTKEAQFDEAIVSTEALAALALVIYEVCAQIFCTVFERGVQANALNSPGDCKIGKKI
jgi:hypothetical protein